MEKLKKDLFKDPELEARHDKTAGQISPSCPVGTSLAGRTIALTNPPACNDRVHDIGF